MRLKLKIKPNKKKNEMIVWIQKHKDLEDDIQKLFQFFEDQITISSITRIHKYYKITSLNPAIMMSLFSSAHDLISEVYFNCENFNLG